jgi:hypothetical protein
MHSIARKSSDFFGYFSISFRGGHRMTPPASNQVSPSQRRAARALRLPGRKQIGDGLRIPNPRVKAALGRLTDQNRIKHVGGSGVTTTYEIIAAP